MRSLVCAVVILLVPVGLTSAGTATHASPRTNGRIFFMGGAVYSMNPDGSGRKRLTFDDRFVFQASPSPDGRQIVFTAFLGSENPDIYVMRAGGSGRRKLMEDPGIEKSPSWSPDGDRIAFTSSRNGDDEIYVIRPKDGALSRLTDNGVLDANPGWSPDGTRLLFTRGPGGNSRGTYDLYVMNADGSGVSRLTNNKAYESDAQWSPDGTRIVFVSATYPDRDIFTVEPDGSAVKRLTFTRTASGPDWSPDGKRIAFTDGQPFSGFNLYSVTRDGDQLVELTPRRGGNPFTVDTRPKWSPDGRQIVFERTWGPHSGSPYIYVIPGETRLGPGILADWAAAVPKLCRVPRVTGMRIARARAAIRRAGCSVGQIRYRRSARPGRVLRQTPRAGTRARGGTRVNLVVGRKPKR